MSTLITTFKAWIRQEPPKEPVRLYRTVTGTYTHFQTAYPIRSLSTGKAMRSQLSIRKPRHDMGSDRNADHVYRRRRGSGNRDHRVERERDSLASCRAPDSGHRRSGRSRRRPSGMASVDGRIPGEGGRGSRSVPGGNASPRRTASSRRRRVEHRSDSLAISVGAFDAFSATRPLEAAGVERDRAEAVASVTATRVLTPAGLEPLATKAELAGARSELATIR